jgi:hypothetical protein
MNTEALKVIETVFFSISVFSFFIASQFWLYRYGYQSGKEVGEHTGFTKGLYQGKIREHHRLTQEARRGKINPNKWANSNTKQTASALSTP